MNRLFLKNSQRNGYTNKRGYWGGKKPKAGQRFNKDAALLLTFSQQRLEQPPSPCSASALLPEVQASAAGSWFCAWCLWHCGDSEGKTVSQTHPGPVRLACGRAFTKRVHQPCNVNTGLHPVPLLPGFNFQAKKKKRVHASRTEAIGRAACWSSHLFRHVAGSVASPLHMMEDRKDPVATGRRCCQSLRERFSPVTHSRLWVSPPLQLWLL